MKPNLGNRSISSTRNLPLLVPTEQAHIIDIHTWAVVTQASPLRIRLDNDSVALPYTPETLVTGLVVSDRVLVLLMATINHQTRSRRAVILGKAQ